MGGSATPSEPNEGGGGYRGRRRFAFAPRLKSLAPVGSVFLEKDREELMLSPYCAESEVRFINLATENQRSFRATSSRHKQFSVLQMLDCPPKIMLNYNANLRLKTLG